MAEASDNTLPAPPPGMVAMTPPRGCGGYWFAPDPASYLSADVVDEWLTRQTPKELQNSAGQFSSMYLRMVFCEFHLTAQSGEPIPITEETVIARQYPAELATMVYSALEPHLSYLYSKKK